MVHMDEDVGEDESCVSSLLSEEWNSAEAWQDDDEDEDDEVEHDAEILFLRQWDKLERELKARMAHLDMIAFGKSRALVQQIRNRERQSAMVKRNELLQQQLGTDNAPEPSDKLKEMQSSISRVKSKPQSLSRRFYDAIIFEFHSTGRATFSLALHCIALAGILELVGELVRSFMTGARHRLVSTSEWVDTILYGLVFAVGVTLVRWTGYLYWWLCGKEYDCLKFDYHNRIRLSRSGGYLNARIMRAVRSSPHGRVVLFMLGYYMVYVTAQVLISYLFPLCGQQAHLTKYVPSATFRYDQFQTLVDAENGIDVSTQFLCERTCQYEMDRRQAAHVELHRVEREFTKRVLSSDSYYVYWGQWALGWGMEDYGVDYNVPLFNNMGEILFAIGTLIVSKLLGLQMTAMVPA